MAQLNKNGVYLWLDCLQDQTNLLDRQPLTSHGVAPKEGPTAHVEIIFQDSFLYWGQPQG